jgi:hypothetical protein
MEICFDGIRKCCHCGKTLKLIGCERKNGKDNNIIDSQWRKRRWHKKCYKLIREKIIIEQHKLYHPDERHNIDYIDEDCVF